MSDMSCYQLPLDVRPTHYDLALKIDMDALTFSGEVRIHLDVRRDTTEFVLNSVDLVIDYATAFVKGDPSPLRVLGDREYERVVLKAERLFEAGSSAILEIVFSGKVNDLLAGLYQSHFKTPDGENRLLVTTQFEATDARRVFPCWDEPSAKSTFSLVLTVPENLAALSNMPVIREKVLKDGMKEIAFAKTPRMSTYLLHFSVGDFEEVSDRTVDGTLVSVWSTKGKKDQCLFALDVAKRLLPWFNNYFGIPYPLPKMDLLAIPDFAAGAMENWGILTYRETALLVDPAVASARTRQRVAIVVAHEMAHQWFGDLVTMAWWDDLWLNEGFASWMEVKAVDYLFPEWRMWELFQAEDMTEAFDLDGMEESHPVQVDVRDPHEINEIFDAISYTKGGSLIRMLEGYLGEDVFREGLSDYLKRHSYGNARTQDLWNALGRKAGQDVRSIMESWTLKKGYPVVRLEEKNGLLAVQEPFANHPERMKELLSAPSKDRWQVMMGVRLEENGRLSERSFLLGEGKTNCPFPLESIRSLNVGGRGFYRVKNEGSLRTRILSEIAAGRVSAAESLGFVNDEFSLALAGISRIEDFLDTVNVFRTQESYVVWADIIAHLCYLDQLLAFEPAWGSFAMFIRDVCRGGFERLGWVVSDGEDHQTRLLRSLLLGALGRAGDESVLTRCEEMFLAFLKDPSSLHPDLRIAVFRTVIAGGRLPDAFGVLREKALTESHQEEKMRFLTGLASSRKAEEICLLLEDSLSDRIRSQDTVSVVASVADNPYGREHAWTFFTERFQEFSRRYSSGGFALSRLIRSMGDNRKDPVFAGRIQEFFEKNPLTGGQRAIRQTLESIDFNRAVWSEQGEGLSKKLSALFPER